MQKTCDFLKFCCKTANGERLYYLVTVESLDLTKKTDMGNWVRA